MWCPSCRAEYVDGVTTCPECNVELVAELPVVEPEYVPAAWELAGEFTDEVAARLAEGLLDNNDIPCKVEDVTFHAQPVPVSQDMATYRLWVEPDNLESARKLLAEAENYGLCSECGGLVTKEDKACPSCGTPLEE
jgi:RNA polymerase subunit RPABC4/transcription elongation factor Spt4